MQTELDRFRRPFDILGLDPTASEEEIDKQRRRLVLKVHPDKTRGDEATQKANEAKTREYNNAHEEAISFVRDPCFQQIKTFILQQKRAEEERERRTREIETRTKRQQFFYRMIDIISDRLRQLNDNYSDSEFKQKTGSWTAEQYQEAHDAVQFGLSDSRNMLSDTRSQLEKATQENARLREQVGQRDMAAAEIHTRTQQKLQKLKEMEIQITKRAEIAEAKAKEWEQKYTELQIRIENESTQQKDSEKGCKKRKHTKFLENESDCLAFQANLTSFIQTRIHAEKSGFLSTSAIKQAFIEYTGKDVSSQFFFKHLKKGIEDIFSAAAQGSSNGERGYRGVAFIE
jgi:hypothetical protein